MYCCTIAEVSSADHEIKLTTLLCLIHTDHNYKRAWCKYHPCMTVIICMWQVSLVQSPSGSVAAKWHACCECFKISNLFNVPSSHFLSNYSFSSA